MKTGTLPLAIARPTSSQQERVICTPPESIPEIVREIERQGGNSPQETARLISQCRTAVMKKRVSIYGQEIKRPPGCLPWRGILENFNSYYLPKGEKSLRIRLPRSHSLYLEGLEDISITIEERSKYVMLLGCRRCDLLLRRAPVVGLYFLRCSAISNRIEGETALGYSGFENTDKCEVHCLLHDNFTLTTFSSQELKVNGTDIPINVFDRWTKRVKISPRGNVEMELFAYGDGRLIPRLQISNF